MPEHADEHIEIAARAAYGAVEGYTIANDPLGAEDALSYDELPDAGKEFMRTRVRDALAGRPIEPSGNHVRLTGAQERARSCLFASVAIAAVTSLEMSGRVDGA